MSRLGKHFGGYRPSPASARGTHAVHELPRFSALRLPASADNSNLIPYVLDQGQEGSCVGHGVAEAIWGELCHGAVEEGKPTPECPSPFWLYWLGRVLDGSVSSDAGTYISSVFEQVAKFGFLSNADLPYDDTVLTIDNVRVPSLERIAYDQRLVTGCARITSTGTQRVNEIKAALAAAYLVVFGVIVDMAFEMLQPGEVWPGIYGTSQPLGGHCLLAVGYNENTISVLNSWGPDWCNNGFCMMYWSAVQQFDDVWIVASSPSYSGTKEAA
jgi:C1A family cysteine protease